MNGYSKVLGYLMAAGFLIAGTGFLFLWYRERKFPDQKKLGFLFVAMGTLLLLAQSMGWLRL